MMDLKPEVTEQEDTINVNGDSETGEKKICCFCQTTKTPLWRQGPSGPKSLCNACGIKYNKKRRAAMGFERGRKSEKKTMMMKKKRSICSGGNKMRVRETLKLRLKELEREMVLQRSDRDKSQKLGEEERAAILLMALSYGYVYA